jgi:NAD(P)-dependent dehydrogenase (short-subunit alcohol dehydrogenase family)
MNRLLNRITMITGAASGIGKATALRFYEEGAFVLVTDINDTDGERVVAQLPGRSRYRHLDVSKEEEWRSVFSMLEEEYRRLDVLVNNAGIDGSTQTMGPFDPEGLNLESWHHVHAVNSDGVALGCKYAIQLMKKNLRGSIVNISSRSGVVGIPRMAAYASSKASVRNHTKSVALYCAEKRYNIRCNSIHPGAILTPMWDPVLGQDQKREYRIRKLANRIPLGRMGAPLDVANAVLYLASDESEYVTGIELTVDGGIQAGTTATPSDVE